MKKLKQIENRMFTIVLNNLHIIARMDYKNNCVVIPVESIVKNINIDNMDFFRVNSHISSILKKSVVIDNPKYQIVTLNSNEFILKQIA